MSAAMEPQAVPDGWLPVQSSGQVALEAANARLERATVGSGIHVAASGVLSCCALKMLEQERITARMIRLAFTHGLTWADVTAGLGMPEEAARAILARWAD